MTVMCTRFCHLGDSSVDMALKQCCVVVIEVAASSWTDWRVHRDCSREIGRSKYVKEGSACKQLCTDL